MAVQLTTEYQLLAEDWFINSYGDTYIRLYAKYSDRDTVNKTHKVWYQSRIYYNSTSSDPSQRYIQDGTENAYNSISGTDAPSITKLNYQTVDRGKFWDGETVLLTTSGTTSNLTVTGTAFIKFSGWSGQPEGEATATATLPSFIVDPTIDNVLCEETSIPGQVHYKVEASPGSSAISSYQWIIGSISSSLDEGYINNFAENKLVGWWVRVFGEDGGTATTSGAFYISHTTAPAIETVSYVDGTRSGTTYTSNDTYTGTISYHVEYTGLNVGLGSRSLEYGIGSYSSNAITTSTGNDVVWNLSNLQPNTVYQYRITETDDAHTPLTTQETGTFLVTGIDPLLTSIVLHRGYTSCTMSPTCKYDVNATPTSNDCTTITVDGFITPFKGNRNIVEITGLQSNTSYDTVTVVKDAFGRDSNPLPWAIYTDPYPTEITNLGFNSVDTTSLTPSVQFTAEPSVDTSGEMRIRGITTTYNNSASSSKVSSPWTVNFGSLLGDNDYEITATLTNSIGSDSRTITGSTSLAAPIIDYTITEVEALDAFTIQAVVSASTNPSGRTLSYRFSKNAGQTWTAYQSSPVYTWTNLNEHTTYDICIEVKASHIATYSQDSVASLSYSITTPYDQAIVAIRDGDWKYGKLYYNQNGNWLKAKKVYIKQNGSWIENKNFR